MSWRPHYDPVRPRLHGAGREPSLVHPSPHNVPPEATPSTVGHTEPTSEGSVLGSGPGAAGDAPSAQDPYNYDAADLTWSHAEMHEVKWATFYVDRDLTRWERFKIRWLRRPDPRILHNGPPDPDGDITWTIE